MADNNKILEMFRMIREDIADLNTRLNSLPCSAHTKTLQTVNDYVTRKLKDETIARHTFIKEIVKYAVPAIIIGIMIILANAIGG